MNIFFSFLLPIYIIEKLGESTTQVKLSKIWPNNFPKCLYDKFIQIKTNN